MTDTLTWPARPTCHDHEHSAKVFGETHWRGPRTENRDDKKYGPSPYQETFRTCSYCGSMNPEDLFNALGAGAKIGRTDKTYKVYVEGMPNPKAGQTYQSYTHTGRLTPEMAASGEWEEVPDGFDSVTGKPKVSYRKVSSTSTCPPTLFAKFYNDHLQDLDDATLRALSDRIAAAGGPHWWRQDGQLYFGSRRPSEQS